MPPLVKRCAWVNDDPLYIAYHDEEWGVPAHDDRHLFEMLTLEGAQAGLSWITILRKRASYRRAFAGFDPAVVALFGPAEVAERLADPGIVRNRLKVESTVRNAKAFLALQAEHGSFDRFVWDFVGGHAKQNRRKASGDVPPRTEVSDALSKELLRRGFKFVGSTICYAYMQATGMVNDHLLSCFRHAECAALSPM